MTTEEKPKPINYMQPLEATTPRKPLPIVGWRGGEVIKDNGKKKLAKTTNL